MKSKYSELSWLRIKMSNHRFSNLKKLFSGNLNSKVMKHVFLLDFHIKKTAIVVRLRIKTVTVFTKVNV